MFLSELHCFLAFIVSEDTSSIFIFYLVLCTKHIFFFGSFKMVSLSLFLSNLITSMIYFGVFFFLFFIPLTWGSFTFLDLWVYSFHQICKLFGHISSNFFFSSIFFGNSNYPYFGLLDMCLLGTLWGFFCCFFPPFRLDNY